MELDHDILERIRMYYAGELSANESKQLESLLASDQRYAWHERLFRTARSGIKDVTDKTEQEWMDALEEKEIDVEEEKALNRLKKNDRPRPYLSPWVLSAAAAVAVLAFFVLFQPEGADGDRTLDEMPIAGETGSEETELLGATGKGIRKEAEVWTYDATDHSFRPTAENRMLLVEPAMDSLLSYRFRANTLTVFTPDPEALQNVDIQWLVKEDNGREENFLRIGDLLYATDPASESGPLKAISDKDL